MCSFQKLILKPTAGDVNSPLLLAVHFLTTRQWQHIAAVQGDRAEYLKFSIDFFEHPVYPVEQDVCQLDQITNYLILYHVGCWIDRWKKKGWQDKNVLGAHCTGFSKRSSIKCIKRELSLVVEDKRFFWLYQKLM